MSNSDDEFSSDEEDYDLACQTCGTTEGDLLPCAHCEMAVYCSVKCQAEDWETDHQHECSELIANGNRRGGRRGGSRRGRSTRGRGGRRVPRRAPRRGYRGRRVRVPTYSRRGRSYYRGYRGTRGFWLWHALFGYQPWFAPSYYRYFDSWYPSSGYTYAPTTVVQPTPDSATLQAPPEAPPALGSFSTELSPPEVDQRLQTLRRQHARFAQRSGYVIVPDYETGTFRWAISE